MWMTWDRLSQVKEMIRDDGIRKIMEIQDIISDLTGASAIKCCSRGQRQFHGGGARHPRRRKRLPLGPP